MLLMDSQPSQESLCGADCQSARRLVIGANGGLPIRLQVSNLPHTERGNGLCNKDLSLRKGNGLCKEVICLLGDVDSVEEVVDFSGTVHEFVQMNAHAIEQREVQVGQIRSLLVTNVPATLQTGCGAACDQDRKVLVIVKARITHAAAVQIDRVIQK